MSSPKVLTTSVAEYGTAKMWIGVSASPCAMRSVDPDQFDVGSLLKKARYLPPAGWYVRFRIVPNRYVDKK